MSRINDMIKKFCPEGVKWVKLGDVANIARGASPRPITAFLSSDKNDVPWIKIGDVSSTSKYITSAEERITTEGAKKSRMVHKGNFILSNSMSFGRPYILGIDGCVHDGWIIISGFDTILTTDFFYYILKADSTQNYWKMKANNGGAMTNLNSDIVRETPIPLPPLPIQQSIVDVLDKFEAMRNNLNAELALRRKQYEAILDKYFGFNYDEMTQMSEQGRFEIKKFNEVGSLTTGRRFVRTDIREKGVPCIHYGDMYTYYGTVATQTKTFLDVDLANKLRFAEPNDVVIVCAGENDWDIGVGLAWLGKEKVVVHDACCIFKHSLNPKYVSYYLRCNNYHSQIRKYVSSGKISAISAKNLGQAFIPVYPRDIQDNITTKLDKFEALISNIEREIELRTKQYEYYREKLLTF